MKPDTLQILRDFQKWRLGQTDEMPGDDATYPKKLTAAINDAIAELEKLAPIAAFETCKADWGGRKTDCPHWQHGCCINDCKEHH